MSIIYWPSFLLSQPTKETNEGREKEANLKGRPVDHITTSIENSTQFSQKKLLISTGAVITFATLAFATAVAFPAETNQIANYVEKDFDRLDGSDYLKTAFIASSLTMIAMTIIWEAKGTPIKTWR